MWVFVFIGVFYITLVLTQESVSVTTSLITITPAPSLVPSAVPNAYIGESYEPALAAYTTWYCPAGQIWSQIGNYARCCLDDLYVECGMATACLSISLMVGPGNQQTWTCSGTASQTSCVTGFVYPSIGATQAITNIECWTSWNGGDWTATRDIATTSSFPSMITVSTVTSKPIALTLSAQQTSTPSPSASVIIPSKRLDTGAKVGIVVGVLLLVLIALTTAFLIQKRRQHKNRSIQRGTVAHNPTIPSDFGELKPELSAGTEQQELPDGHESSGQRIQEQGYVNADRRDEDAVSVAGSTSAGVILVHGRPWEV